MSIATKLQALLNEVDCRIEHGAEGPGHLEFVRKQLREIVREAWSKPRHDAKGPTVLWIDYGTEGWKPVSFDYDSEAVAYIQEGNTGGSPFVIAKPRGLEVKS